MSSSPTTYSARVYNYNYNLYILNRSYIRKISLHLHYRNYVTFAKLSYILWLKLRWLLYTILYYFITFSLFSYLQAASLLLYAWWNDVTRLSSPPIVPSPSTGSPSCWRFCGTSTPCSCSHAHGIKKKNIS